MKEKLDKNLIKQMLWAFKENPSDAGLSLFRPEDTRLQHLDSDKALDVLSDQTSLMSTGIYSKVAKASQNNLER